MDAMDILGSLLGGGSRGSSGGNSGGGSLGGKILGELLKGAAGGSRQAPQPAPAPAPQQTRTNPRPNHPVNIESEAQSLEDLLGVATGKQPSGRAPAPSSYRPAPEPPRYQPQQPAPTPPRAQPQAQPSQSMTSNDEAVVLIRALINAAKADGRVDSAEQQAILNQVPNDAQTIAFLKQEFAQPLDVRDFVWSVPLGMEVKVYTMSLAGMQLDTNAEAQYLRELAHGLRLDPDLCRQIHARYGVQDIL